MTDIATPLPEGINYPAEKPGGAILAMHEFTARVAADGLTWTHLVTERSLGRSGWRGLIPTHFIVHRAMEGEGAALVYAESADGVALIKLDYGQVSVLGASNTRFAAEAVANEVAMRFRSRGARGGLPVHMWWCGSDGPDSYRDLVAAPDWSESKRNYAASTAVALESLMAIKKPIDRGRLLLWHGEPGTGKTRVLGALGSAWQTWCSVHVVLDPDRFFEDPGYLLHLLAPGREETEDDKWRLIVAEDADDYLRSDARQSSRGALGRLLNATDGIMGRNARSIILLTTNEELGLIDPALTRPGRTLARVEFTKLSPTEARAWLPAGSRGPSGPVTLADLYNNGGQYL